MNVLLLISPHAAMADALREMLGVSTMVLRQPGLGEALSRLETIQPDVIVYDAGTSMDTEPVQAVIASAGPVPISVLTSRDDTLVEAAFLKCGVRTVLRKPFRESDVRALMSSSHALTQTNGANHGTNGHMTKVALHDSSARAMRWLAGSLMEAATEESFCGEIWRAVDDLLTPVRGAVILQRGDEAVLIAQRGIHSDVLDSWLPAHQTQLLHALNAHPAIVWRHEHHRPVLARTFDLLDVECILPLLRFGEVGAAVLIGSSMDGDEHGPESRELLTLLGRMASQRLEQCHRQQARDSEGNLLNDTLSSAPVGLVVVDDDRTIAAVNLEAEKALGIAREEVVGRSVQRLGSQIADAVLSHTQTNVPTRLRVRRPARPGELDVSVAAAGGGKKILTIAIAPELEISASEAGRQEFWQHVAERVAQEIKNPMVAINTFAQLLPRKYDSEDFRDSFSRVMQEEVERINRVVESLFRYAEAPVLQTEEQDVNLSVREAVDAFARVLPERSVELDTVLSEEPLAAHIDADAFRTVMMQLMHNSAEALPEGGKLSIETRKKNDAIEIRVADTGTGLGDTEPRRLFEPFYSTKSNGLGMGLAIADKLVRAHEGSIEVEQQPPGQGCRFVVRLPIKTAVPSEKRGKESYANHPGD